MRQSIAIALSSMFMLQITPLMAGAPMRGPRAVRAQTPATPGAISGTARSTDQALPNYRVQVRNLHTAGLAGNTTSDVAGNFTFTGLPPGSYVVELVDASGAVVGSSAPIVVGADSTAAVSVWLRADRIVGAAAGASGGCVSKALILTMIAAGAGIAGVAIVAKGDPSPSR